MKITLYSLFLILMYFCATVSADSDSETQFSQSSEFHKKFIKIELQEFARANCVIQYLKKHNYDNNTAGTVTGQLFQMGSYAAVRYHDINELVKNYHPKFPSLHDLDIDLFKCFIMMSDKIFIDKLNKIKSKIYSKSDH